MGQANLTKWFKPQRYDQDRIKEVHNQLFMLARGWPLERLPSTALDPEPADEKDLASRPSRNSKLLYSEAEEIRRRAARGDMHKDIADDYGVSASLVSRIVKGKRYGTGTSR